MAQLVYHRRLEIVLSRTDWRGCGARGGVATPPTSNVGHLAEVFVVLVVAALALADGRIRRDELDGTDPLDHLEAELVFDPYPQGRAVDIVERLVIHFVGQEAVR